MKKLFATIAFCSIALGLTAQELGTKGGQYLRKDVPEETFRKATMLFDAGSYHEAEALLQSLIDNKEYKREAAYLLSLIAFERNASSSVETLEEYLATYPDSPNRNHIKSLILQGLYAQEQYEIVTGYMHEINPDLLGTEDRDNTILAYAMSLLMTGRSEEAAMQLGILIAISNRYDTEANYYIAYTDYLSKRYEEAYDGFNRTIANIKGKVYHKPSHYYLAEIALETKDYIQAEQRAMDYIEEYKEDRYTTEMKRIAGDALYAQEKYLNAALILEEYLAESDEPQRASLYRLGMSHFRSNEWLRAPEIFAMTTEEEDEISQSAHLHTGLCYLSTNDKNRARMSFEQAAAMTANNTLREQAMYNYAVCVHETSYDAFGESVSIFERFLNDFPDSPYADRINSYLVETCMHTKNYEAALHSIAKIKRPSATILEAKQQLLYKVGTEAFANGDIDRAIAKMGESLELGNYNQQTKADAFFWRGEAYYRKGNITLAERDFRQYMKLTTDKEGRTYALALYGMGYCCFSRKSYMESFGFFNQLATSPLVAHVDNTTLADTYIRIGDCYYQARQYRNAENAYNQALDADHTIADYAVYQKAFAQGLSGRYSDKVGTLSYLIENFPHSDYVDDAMYEKGRAYVQMNNSASAISTFETLLHQFPKSGYAPKAGNEIGLIHYQNNQVNEAIKAYKKVIAEYPGSEQAHVAMRDLKNLYVEENMVDEYVMYASQTKGMVAVEVNEHDSLAYKAAEIAYIGGDNQKAAEGFEKYLTQFAQGAYAVDAQYYLGCIYHKQNKSDRAMDLLHQVAMQKNSKYYKEALRLVADLAYNKPDYIIARDSYQELAEITENTTLKLYALTQLTRTGHMLSDDELVIRQATAVLSNPKLTPETMNEILSYRAKAYMNNARNDEARNDLQVLSKDTRNMYGAEAKYLLAKLYYDTHQYDNAEKEVLDYINISTPHSYWLARSFILLSDVYVAMGKPIEAKQYLLSLKQMYKANDDIADLIENRLERLNTPNDTTLPQ